MAYGISEKTQSEINKIIQAPIGVFGYLSAKVVHSGLMVNVDRDSISVTYPHDGIVYDYGTCSTYEPINPVSCHLETGIARELVAQYWIAERKISQGATRMWSWDQSKRQATGLTRSQARKQYDTGLAEQGLIMARLENYAAGLEDRVRRTHDVAIDLTGSDRTLWNLYILDDNNMAQILPWASLPEGMNLTPYIQELVFTSL